MVENIPGLEGVVTEATVVEDAPGVENVMAEAVEGATVEGDLSGCLGLWAGDAA